MSPRLAFVSDVLDRLQAAGEKPVVNPPKQPWTPPADTATFWRTFMWGFIALALLVVFWVTFTGDRPGFIYAGF